MKLKIFLFLLLAVAKNASAQLPDYKKAYFLLRDSIQKHYYNPQRNYYREHAPAQPNDRSVSYLWPLCALLEAYQAGAALDGSTADFDATFLIIKKYFSKNPPVPGYASYPPELGGGSRFYDDNQWIGISVMNQYETTKARSWLRSGQEIYRFMMSGYDTAAGGGLYWEEGNRKTKNTCSNGPGILLALQLYKATGDSSYLHTATALYKWVNRWLRTPEGLYYDNLHLKENRVDKRIYSYNTGTMLEANVLFYELTGRAAYLQEAQTITGSAVGYFLKDDGFRNNNWWFNAVLLRAFQHLLRHDKNPAPVLAFQKALDNTLKVKNELGLPGRSGKPQNLVPQGGMLEILARFARLQQQGIIK